MTFAELILLVTFVFGVYWLLRPVQMGLERRLRRLFRARSTGRGPIIDVTEESAQVKAKRSENGDK